MHLIFKEEMKELIFIIIFLLITLCGFGQSQYTISGYVQDDGSGESLIGVSVYDKASYKGTATNQYGFYSLTLEEGVYDILYSFIGYK